MLQVLGDETTHRWADSRPSGCRRASSLQTTPLAPRLAAAQAGQRVVCFMEAAPLVFAPFVGLGGWCERLVVQAPSGRQRCPVLAALQATTRASFTVTTLTYITSETVSSYSGYWWGAIRAC